MTEAFSTHRFPGHVPGERAHHAFEAQAACVPEVCAVMMGGRVDLSYDELNRSADRFAEGLRGSGVGPETIVGVCLERSPALITAILAVLKAGGAYLPLDPAYPAERLAFMLENSAARVLITDGAARQNWPAGLTVIHPDASVPASEVIRADDIVPASDHPASDPLAYVIYTSGSTGRPKGVAMPHGPLCNLLRWQTRACPLAATARVLQFAPISFDVSFQEIFSTLGAGGTLVLIPETLRRDPRALLRLIDEQNIARVFLPPVMLSQLAEQFSAGGVLPRGLREVITAGEALRITPAIAAFFSALQKRGEPCALHNHYGPTETHVATACTLTDEPETWPVLPSIGQPIDRVQIRLLDENGQTVESGQSGALYLGGDCLARGYLHDPELTRARFVELDGARWYRTGDLAQLGPDGQLQFLGRADDQVKIRGFRVELGEIEAALARHPAIRETAVGTVADAAGSSQELIACYVPRDPASAPAVSELRQWLLGQLPDYMLPARFAAVESLPLTPSGKVDRRALSRFETSRGDALPASTAPPKTTLEKTIARVWEETLGLRNAGVQDNFFDVGGNSLHAMQMHTKLCEALSREFPITALFQYPTIAALAAHLTPDERAAGTANPIQDRARRQQQQQAAARVRFAGNTR